ncbi:MAG: hypothetical protein ACI85Z_001504, partial [Rheinheimera aquimaris]
EIRKTETRVKILYCVFTLTLISSGPFLLIAIRHDRPVWFGPGFV